MYRDDLNIEEDSQSIEFSLLKQFRYRKPRRLKNRNCNICNKPFRTKSNYTRFCAKCRQNERDLMLDCNEYTVFQPATPDDGSDLERMSS